MSYERAFSAAIAALRCKQENMLREAELDHACEELLTASIERQTLLARTNSEIGRVEVVLELLRRSETCRFDNTKKMLRLARAGARLALALPGSAAPARILEDIRAQAWAVLANGHRIEGNLQAAEKALQVADRHRAEGTANPHFEAEAAWLKALLRRRQERPEEAVELLVPAISAFEALGDQQAAAKAHITLGITHYEMGNLAGAAARSLCGGQSLDTHAEPDLMVATLKNLVCYLHEAGWDLEAQRFLPRVKELVEARGQDLEILRMRWLEAKIVGEAGDKARARRLLFTVRLAFAERGMAHDAALVALELALMNAEAGLMHEVERLAAEAYPIFRSRALPQKTTAALVLLLKAVYERATASEAPFE